MNLLDVIHRLRLPRIRGDRPYSSRCLASAPSATPHTRGSTPGDEDVTAFRTGYPAYAGIDLKLEVVKRSDERLPRIRGDRPPFKVTLHPERLATPHTRGSTCDDCGRLIPDGGYPAYAGIDPKSIT